MRSYVITNVKLGDVVRHGRHRRRVTAILAGGDRYRQLKDVRTELIPTAVIELDGKLLVGVRLPSEEELRGATS